MKGAWALRILHTSDWHLGRTIEGHSRQSEQEQFIEEVCLLADDQKVDLVLIAGDVFDTFTPSAAAEELYCYALEKLASSGNRAVVVVAGNHDSPDRLTAVQPLARRHGVFIAGLPSATMRADLSNNGVRLIDRGPGWLEIAVAGQTHSAVVSLLPYPSEARLTDSFGAALDEKEIRQAYSQTVGAIFARQAEAFRADTVNLAVSHLFVRGGLSSDSERPIELGGAYTVDIPHLPAHAHYIALGHLHRPQEVRHAPAPTFYSGSPLAYSFSEAGQTKAVYIADIVPGQATHVRPINLAAGVPLEKWRCLGGLEEVYTKLDALAGREVWLDLEVHTPHHLTIEEIARLRRAHKGLVNVRWSVIGGEQLEKFESVYALTLPELFVRYYRYQKGGVAPKEELTELFVELVNRSSVRGQEREVEL